MDARHSQLIAKLSEQGWRVAAREREDLEWWADEIWAVESEWAPRGFTVYLTWLVDPQWADHRQPGQAVWAIGVSLQRPSGGSEAGGELHLSIKHWPRELPQLLTGLAGLRDEHRRTDSGT